MINSSTNQTLSICLEIRKKKKKQQINNKKKPPKKTQEFNANYKNATKISSVFRT